MALLDKVMHMMALAPWDHPPVQTRSESLTLADLVARMSGSRVSTWRPASVEGALSVPAVFRAVTLISNLVGSLTLRTFRNGVELSGDDRPRLVIRPNPFTTPREFFRETAYSMAVYGEAWWWIAARDVDNLPLSLIPVHPREVTVDENPVDLRFPLIKWRNRPMLNSDMVQIKMTGEPGALRGHGPLQKCGAAISVAVEAQEWAANFYATGGATTLWVKGSEIMSPDEAVDFKAQWLETPNGELRVTGNNVEDVQDITPKVDAAQMHEARAFQVGEVVRMFGLTGGFLEYAMSGSSITYQNVGQEFTNLLRVCLLPDYCEPVEQAMSDLLTRSTISRFNTADLERADIGTLYSVATTGFEKGLIDQTEGRAIVGLAPSIENAAVPFSPPAAFPASAEFVTRSEASPSEPSEVRCANCGKLLGKLTAPYEVVCQRCKTLAAVAA